LVDWIGLSSRSVFTGLQIGPHEARREVAKH